MRVSRPRLSAAIRSRNSPRREPPRADTSPRRLPRIEASARFSSIDSAPQLPAKGSWKTRATSPARAAVVLRDTSVWPIVTRPDVGRTSPARTPSRVDLPAPLEPITVTKEPDSIVRLTFFSACFCNGVPRPNTTYDCFQARSCRCSSTAQSWEGRARRRRGRR